MKQFRLKKQLLLLFLGGMLLMGCDKTKERVYELLPPDPEMEEDRTDYGTLSVNIENTGGASANEGSSKVVDSDLDSKFLIFSYNSEFYMQLDFPSGQRIAAYTLTSANDAASRDPRNWTITASNDGEEWVELDARENETFSERKLTKRFNFLNSEEYRYYRINITAIGSGDLFQLAEWRMINVPLDQQVDE